MNYSVSEQNYIKSIYHLRGDRELVTTNRLAAELLTKPASVTDMLKKLKMKNLLSYERYKGFRLSAEGRRVALGIIRRHRLWESFLSEKLLFTWDEVHEVAEELEHVTHPKLIEKLDAYLGYPKFDPHGEPIPDRHGKMESLPMLLLSECPAGETLEVAAVSDQRPEILELLSHHRIGIGSRLQLMKRFGFDRSLEIQCETNPPIVISALLAEQIRVKKITS
jgi:DtxR family Mn-dependent transcriptional regulator